MQTGQLNLWGKIKIENDDKIYITLSDNEKKKQSISVHKTTIKSKLEDANYYKYVNSTELSKNTSIN